MNHGSPLFPSICINMCSEIIPNDEWSTEHYFQIYEIKFRLFMAQNI